MYVAALKDRRFRSMTTLVYSMPQEAALLTLHDKHSFVRLAGTYGLDVPETYRLSDTRAVSLAEAVDTVVKPVLSCAGSGVRFLRRGETLPPDDPDRPRIVQTRLHGHAISSFSIVHEGRVLLTTLYRGKIMTGTVAVGFERVDDHQAVHDWIQHFVQQSGSDGLISFDFIVSDEGRAFAIECNPRVTSGVHYVATDNIAPIMLYPNRTTPPRRTTHRDLQQFWPCLTETQAAILKPRQIPAPSPPSDQRQGRDLEAPRSPALPADAVHVLRHALDGDDNGEDARRGGDRGHRMVPPGGGCCRRRRR